MSDVLDLIIDLNPADLGLDPEELETYSQNLIADLKEGLAEDAKLARVENIPEGSKAGQAGFNTGILQVEVNLESLIALFSWLRNRISGKPILEIEYGDVKLKYRTDKDLEQQLAAVEKISHLTVRVVKQETNED